MTPADLEALRQSASPQPASGALPPGFSLAILRPPHNPLAQVPAVQLVGFWDSRQTADFLCATPDLALVRELLELELASPGAVRELLFGPREEDLTPTHLNLPQGSVRIDLSKIRGPF